MFGRRQQPVGLIKPVGLCNQVLQHSKGSRRT